MPQYDFVEPSASPANHVGLTTAFNGVVLDEVGATSFIFQTLKVEGRALIKTDIKSQAKEWSDGSWLTFSRIPSREIVVTALIGLPDEVRDKAQHREMWEALNRILTTRQPAELKFSDDAYSYMALYSGSSGVSETSYSEVVNLTFTCLDPYKYKPAAKFAINAIPGDFNIPVTPSQMEIVLAEDTDTIKISNAQNGQNIVFHGDFKTGQKITIQWNESIIAVDGSRENMLPKLDILSDIEMFEFKSGDSLSVVPSSSTVQIEARAKAL